MNGGQRQAARQIVADWPLERVVGQVFCVSVGHHSDGAYGFTDTVDDVAAQVAELELGGVCYFPDGADGARPEAIAERVARLQAAAAFPLLVTIDQEGGLVTRMREPATRWPSAMAQTSAFGGEGAEWQRVSELAEASGLELRAAGVGLTFAPVADVNVEPSNPVIGIRSAGSDPEQVAHFVTASVQGLASAGVGSCLKHFPGHGNTRVDSHVALPTLSTTLEQWWRGERIPFAAGIAADVDSVMVGHLRAPGLDPSGVPATFSRAIVRGLLRERLGFEGVVVTDAMDMAGAQVHDDEQGRPGPAVACLMALQAGVDQVLMPRDAAQAIALVLDAVRAGELDEAALRMSAERIVALKLKLGLAEDTAGIDVPDLGAHRELARQAIARSLVWRGEPVRLGADRPVVLVHDPEPPNVGRGIEDVPTALAEGLRGRGLRVEQRLLGDDQPAEDALVLMITRDAWRFAEVAERVRSLASRVDVAVLARSPHDDVLLGEQTPALMTFGDIPGVAAAVVDELCGSAQIGPTPAPTIRPYRASDREAIGRICLRTGASGVDATGQFADDGLLPWIYAWPYVDFEPESCLVVDLDGEAVGYVLGVGEVAAFARWWADEWTPRFAERFPKTEAWGPGEQNLVRRGLHPELMVADHHAEIPAELHIDLLPVVQGKGLGRELIARFAALMAERGVARIGLGVGARNERAIAFYRRLGFETLREHRDADGQLVALTMWLPTGAGAQR